MNDDKTDPAAARLAHLQAFLDKKEMSLPLLVLRDLERDLVNAMAARDEALTLIREFLRCPSGTDVRLLAVGLGGTPETLNPVLEAGDRLDAARAAARALLEREGS